MMKLIENTPANVLAIEASGEITAQDYETVLIPETDKVMDAGGAVHMVYVLKDVKHFDLAAMWEDTVYGLKHWTHFEKIALVTDLDWVKTTTQMFIPFFPGQVQIFPIKDQEKAIAWAAD